MEMCPRCKKFYPLDGVRRWERELQEALLHVPAVVYRHADPALRS